MTYKIEEMGAIIFIRDGELYTQHPDKKDFQLALGKIMKDHSKVLYRNDSITEEQFEMFDVFGYQSSEKQKKGVSDLIKKLKECEKDLVKSD